jgi:transmembrane sensor
MNQREDIINALLLDNRFVDWVINQQSPYAEYWLQWIASNAEHAALAEEARRFLIELRKAEMDTDDHRTIHESSTEQLWQQIRNEIEQAPVIPVQKRPVHRWYWVAAAAVVGLIVWAGMVWIQPARQSVVTAEKTGSPASASEILRYNGSDKNELFFLPDGSSVVLAKGARITYNRLLNGQKREVSLTGEAFFNVAKNPHKPFYIYTPNMVVKVLGTSFRVTTNDTKESVAVKTGKVSVFMKGQDLEQSAPQILYPQQVCTYSVPKKELVLTALMGNTKIEMETARANHYNFEDASVDTVFKTLEKMYALPVHYDKPVFESCFITISLGNESLEEILEVITKTIGATFSISDYGINIEGKGCKN